MHHSKFKREVALLLYSLPVRPPARRRPRARVSACAMHHAAEAARPGPAARGPAAHRAIMLRAACTTQSDGKNTNKPISRATHDAVNGSHASSAAATHKHTQVEFQSISLCPPPFFRRLSRTRSRAFHTYRPFRGGRHAAAAVPDRWPRKSRRVACAACAACAPRDPRAASRITSLVITAL